MLARFVRAEDLQVMALTFQENSMKDADLAAVLEGCVEVRKLVYALN